MREWLGIGVLVIFVLWLVISSKQLVSRKGKLKRGVLVKSEALSEEIMGFLRALHGDIEVRKRILGFNPVTSFIKSEGSEVLIFATQEGYSTSFPYVGYVNLEARYPQIQFRTAWPIFLVLLPFIFVVWPIPFIVLIQVWNYRKQRSIILNFLKKQVELRSQKIG